MKTKKEKMYDPEKTGSFRMMFGFPQPYVYANRRTSSGIKDVYVNLKADRSK